MERLMFGEFMRGLILGLMLEVIVLVVEDFKNVNICRRMSVYVVVWVMVDYKGIIFVCCRVGWNFVWNDILFFLVNDDIFFYLYFVFIV